MKELLNIGQALGRDEMKKLMAGSGSGAPCYQTCSNILSSCLGGNPNHPSQDEYPEYNNHCMWITDCCMAQCDGGGPGSC